MVKKQIKEFELKTEGGSYPCTLPCRVGRVLSAAGASSSELGDFISFDGVISADEVALSIKYFYLRIRGINRPAEIFLNGQSLLKCDGFTPVYNVDISGQVTLGDNILSMRFYAADGDLSCAEITELPEIVRFNSAIIDSVALTQHHEDGAVNLGIKLSLLGDTSSVRAVATLVSSAGQLYYAGLTGGEGSVILRDPLYWWPRGLGVQNLYRLTVNLYGEIDIEDSYETRLGLRKIELGEGATLTVNGSKMIPMGAVYYADSDPDSTIADDRISKQVTAATMAGYNCLVLPLSSPAPSEKLYELCDVHGILLIEEHRADDSLVIPMLKARIDHPSLCLVDLITDENTEADASLIKEALPQLNIVSVSEGVSYISKPALPSMKSICAIVPEGERNLFSRHIEAIAEDGAIKNMLMSVADRYPYPRDLSAFAYASALASAHAVGEEIKSCRLSDGSTGRAVFNRLCDSSFMISPSAIDYRGRWKPLQYYCSRFFAPLALYAEMQGEELVFSASNLRRFDFIGNLEYRVADANNYTLFKSSEPLEISGASQGRVFSTDISEVISGHENEYYLEYCLREGSSALAHGVLLFVPEKHFDFKKALIDTKITGQDKNFSLTISADKFVKDLEIDFEGVDGVFSDNYINLTSGAPVKIGIKITDPTKSAEQLSQLLRIRSVQDLK